MRQLRGKCFAFAAPRVPVRRIITDYLSAGGTRDEHSMGSGQVVPMTLTSGARVMVDATLRDPAPGGAEVPGSDA
jgi:hypothetical protein